ncbi:MAG TPA: hypothetical protein VM430_09215 [Microbacterium sp.]|nr:hypothetical protein [Microbacterium sp.]
MPLTPNYGLPYQTENDLPDGPDLGEGLATSLDVLIKSAKIVANSAARVAISGAALYEGLIVAQQDDFSGWIYLVGAWRQIWSISLGGGGGGGTGSSLDVAAYSNSATQTFGTSGSEYPVAFPQGGDSASVTRSTKGVGHQFHLQPGTYLVDSNVRFASGPQGSRFIGLRTADDISQYATAQNDGGPAAANRTFAKVITLNSAADLYLVASQSSGGSLSTQATSSQAPSGYVAITFTRLG